MPINHKLFCFTHAGGTASFFDIIEKSLSGIKLVKLEYAGHGERHREQYYKDFNELGDDIFEKIKSFLSEGDYSLFGYSMGSITLVEVLKRIISAGMKKPSNVFLAAHEPHTKAELAGFSDDELDEWVKNRTIQFGDVPEKLVENKVFWRTYLPIYRADYSIIMKYDFGKLDLETEIPATVFYSETDTPLQEMKKWKKYFKGDCNFIEYPGSHFFIRKNHSKIAYEIRKIIGANNVF